YERRLYGFALRMTGNREDAEEIVQDAFVRAYRALAKMSPEQRAELRLQPWLYTITLNVTRNRLRGKRPTNVALDSLGGPHALWDDIREGMPPLRAAVHDHLRACQRCQDLYEQYEGVAYCLSCLPQPEPSCNLAKRVIEHIATLQNKNRSTPIVLTWVNTRIGRAY